MVIVERWMLGTFLKAFSQAATSQMCNFPRGNFPSLSQLQRSVLQPVLVQALSAPQPQRLVPWGSAWSHGAALGPHSNLWCLKRSSLTFGKFLLGKFLLGKLSLGKLSLGKSLLIKYLWEKPDTELCNIGSTTFLYGFLFNFNKTLFAKFAQFKSGQVSVIRPCFHANTNLKCFKKKYQKKGNISRNY